jgi:very-short-patch-repair endonuclease
MLGALRTLAGAAAPRRRLASAAARLAAAAGWLESPPECQQRGSAGGARSLFCLISLRLADGVGGRHGRSSWPPAMRSAERADLVDSGEAAVDPIRSAIKTCGSVAELEAVLQGADPAAVDFIPLSAALSLLPKLPDALKDPAAARRLWSSLARWFLAPDMIKTAGARALCNVLWATAKLVGGRVLEASSAEAAALVGAILSELQRGDKLSDANAQELSNALWALATLGRAGDGAFVSALLEAVLPQLGSFNPQALANTLWALATLGRTGDGAFVSALLEAVLPQLGSFNPQDLANTLWALATLGRTGDGAFVSALLEAALPQLGSFNPQALANTLWALATLGRTGDGAFVSALIEAALPQLGSFNPQNVANTLWALATLGRTGDGAFVSALLAAALPQLGSFNPQNVAITAWTLAKLAHCADPLLETAADLVLSLTDRMTPQNISNTAYAFATLRHPRASALVAALVERSAARLADFTEQNLTNLLWSVAAADARSLSAAALGALAAGCAREERKWSASGLSQLHLAHMHVKGAYDGYALLPPPLLARCIEAQTLRQAQIAAQPISNAQRQLVAALRRLGLSPQEEAPALDGAYSIDALLVTPSGARVAVEFDGPHHFAANAPTRALGDTALRDRMLSGAGFVVVSVTYREWYGKSEAERDALLRARLRSAGVL